MHYILAVGDDEDDIPLLVQALTTELSDFTVRTVVQGAEAFEIIRSSSPEEFPALIILEVSSHEPGLAFVQELRKEALHRRIPVVVISRFIESSLLKKLYAEGVNCFIPKPLDETEWHHLVECIDLLFLQNLRPPGK